MISRDLSKLNYSIILLPYLEFNLYFLLSEELLIAGSR